MLSGLNILLLTAAYLLGSIPTAVWWGKSFYGIDVREYGSGNAGATNTFRVLGRKAGIPVLLMDIFKGWLSVNLCRFSAYPPNSEHFINMELALAIGAVVGHIFPVFAGFRGGKGIATLLGIGIAIHPLAAALCLTVFLIVLLIAKYVSLGSIIAGLSFPLLIIFYFKNTVLSLNVFAATVGVMVIITHQKNIERLLKGKESKTYLIKATKPSEDNN